MAESVRSGDLQVDVGLVRPGAGPGVPDFQLDMQLRAPPGITILFGPSGSGKSTVLQAIAGLVSPDRGRISLGDRIWYSDKPPVDVPPHRRKVAYVFQSLALFPHLTAVGNVCYGIDRQVPRAERRHRAHALLERLGVAHLAHRRPRTFSGGEAQRVALARSLATDPQVLLLDEPFSALDRDLRIQLVGVVRSLVDERQMPAIQVTHNVAEARALGDHVLRVQNGRIVERGSVKDILGSRRGHLEETPMPVLVRDQS